MRAIGMVALGVTIFLAAVGLLADRGCSADTLVAIGRPAPEITGGPWINSAPLSLAGLRGRVVLVAPPFIPYAPAWQAAGVDLRWLAQVEAPAAEALWAAEQCLRSGSCAAVLCWPGRADDRALRRLQVAAETGQALAFVCRGQQALHNPSPAALRIAIDTRPAQWRVLKCRGGLSPAAPIACPVRS